MTIPFYEIDEKTEEQLHVAETPFGVIKVVESVFRLHGVFKSATRTTAGTTIIVAPDTGGSIVLTDLIISTDKTNGTTTTIQFTDGSQTITLFSGDSTNNSINLAISFGGRWEGWMDSRLELVTAGGNVTATASVGYFKLSEGKQFSVWDKLR